MANPHVYKSEDGSYNIEWIFDGYRFGISLDKDIEDSGWFFVSDCGNEMSGELGPLPAYWNLVLFDLMEKTHPGETDIEWATEAIKELGLEVNNA